MTLLKQILLWTESLPLWQRDACRRLLQKEKGLGQLDYKELYSFLKQENGIEVAVETNPVPLSQQHIPSDLAHGEKVTLMALRELQNVNQISNENTLTFSELGMTVIYGGNGSGKSGYARVMKKACRARDQSETVHPNANDPSTKNKVPTAKFDIKIKDALRQIEWSRDSTAPDLLSSISVFDSQCARSYVTTEHDVAYLPYGLDVVERLANQVIPKLTEMLDIEIRGVDVGKVQFGHLVGETAVGKTIQFLSAQSDADSISKLGTLNENDINRIEELESILKESSPLVKAEELRRSAMRLKIYADTLERPLEWISSKAVEKIKRLSEEKHIAEQAEKNAADALRADEKLFIGTGEKAWKSLFEAARRFSMEEVHIGETFPQHLEGKNCPLCQQSLTDSAFGRLKRFDEYIQNDVAKAADKARKKLEVAKNKIESANLEVAANEALVEELVMLDGSINQALTHFQDSMEARRELMIQCLDTSNWSEICGLDTSPRVRVRKLAAQQLKSYRTLLKVADEKKRKALESELEELISRNNLEKVLNSVLELLERMKKRVSLEKCRRDLKTRPISDKSKEFATIAVTSELKKFLDIEFKALGIEHIKTKLNERSSRGKMYHQLLLDIPVRNKIEEILSEGEQRAIALGSFFAELKLANHSCGVVFDDPVSSLDHWRRLYVARRLVKEAKNRQVVVFTHDTSFLGQLLDEIETEKISKSICFLEWRGGSSGSVNDGLPWDHQGYKARIDTLGKAQSKLKKSWSVYPNENDIRDIRQQYDRLRATLERIIQDVVFNGVVKRYRDWIRIDSLEGVIGFSREEYESINKLHKRSCDVITAHDQSSDKAAAIPSPNDLGDDIESLKAIVEEIQQRKKEIKSLSTS